MPIVVNPLWPNKKSRNFFETNIKNEDIHEESLENYPSWWWKIKMTSGKVGGLKCITLAKLATYFLFKNGFFDENIFIGVKKYKFG